MTSENILDGADDKRTDPKFNHKIGFIPFAYHLVPLKGLAKVATVMRKGERKDRNGWEGVSVEEHLNHAISHIVAYLAERHTDHHLANAGCRILMALDLDKKEILPHPSTGSRKSPLEEMEQMEGKRKQMEGKRKQMEGKRKLDLLSLRRKEQADHIAALYKEGRSHIKHPDWVEPQISDKVDLAHSIKETFDRVVSKSKRGNDKATEGGGD